MAKTIRLTESELKNMIIESMKNILKEGMNDTSSNTHYAIHKPSKKIVFSWDYSGISSYELGQYRKDYFINDLTDMGMNPQDIVIWSRRTCINQGIDPSVDSNWSNYPMEDKSMLNEIGDTDRGQELLGRAAGRAQKRAQNIGRSNDFDGYCKSMSKADKMGNYARDARIKTTGKADDVNGAFTKGVRDEKKKEINEATANSFITVDFNLDDVMFTQPLDDFIADNYNDMPNTVEVNIEYKYIPFRPKTYWEPEEGGNYEILDFNVLTEPFAEIIPQEFFQEFVDTVNKYANDNIESLFEHANLDTYDEGPDPDEAHERYLEKKYGY